MNLFKNDKITIFFLLIILVIIIALSSFLSKKSNETNQKDINKITIKDYEYSQEAENYFIEQGEKNYNELFSASNFTNNNEENLEIITDAD